MLAYLLGKFGIAQKAYCASEPTAPTHYEHALMAQAAYNKGGVCDSSEWRVVSNRDRDYELGFSATTYQNDKKKAVIIAYRGTQNQWNWVATNFLLPFSHLPTTLPYAVEHAKASIARVPRGYAISTTGHSLGAALSELIACQFRLPAVTFESPGVRHIIEIVRNSSEESDRFKDPEAANITCYLTAPNAVNTLNSHVGILYRVYIPHVDGVRKAYVAKALLGTTKRLALYSLPIVGSYAGVAAGKAYIATGVATAASTTAQTAIANAIAAQLTSALVMAQPVSAIAASVQATIAGAAMSAAVTSASAATLATATAVSAGIEAAFASSTIMGTRITEGVVNTVEWAAKQHSMDGIVNQFDPETSVPKKYALITSWPATLQLTDSKGITGWLPFQPTNPGVHNIYGENEVIEAQIETMPGYKVGPILGMKNNHATQARP